MYQLVGKKSWTLQLEGSVCHYFAGLILGEGWFENMEKSQKSASTQLELASLATPALDCDRKSHVQLPPTLYCPQGAAVPSH
jgi:hypothetical protein